MLHLYTHSTKELLTLSIGDRIKKARVFRGMTQKELGIAVGFNEKNADMKAIHGGLSQVLSIKSQKS